MAVTGVAGSSAPSLALAIFLVAMAVLWEAFKWLFGDPWRLTGILGTGIELLPRRRST